MVLNIVYWNKIVGNFPQHLGSHLGSHLIMVVHRILERWSVSFSHIGLKIHPQPWRMICHIRYEFLVGHPQQISELVATHSVPLPCLKWSALLQLLTT